MIAARGAAALVVDDLRTTDLERIGWSSSPLHVHNVGQALARRDAGELDYLAARAPTGEPIAKGAVDHVDLRGPGKLWQLATHLALQGLGIGSALIRALETASSTVGTPPPGSPSNRPTRELERSTSDSAMRPSTGSPTAGTHNGATAPSTGTRPN